ncbi:MAG: histone deacetylase [Jaaginema sp. PMC 1079.18]|nr:histone deacetylase [Jaaginema sp. PMC 1080.18]MEC4853154.1 histone deacetylase [Jaaginema sp. PMC 1079.18]MEC4867745.1 histone deacetylase [Jaaginema sp. PMC 1078.18]
MVCIIYSGRFLDHDNGRSHPERPERLTAIVNALKQAPWANYLEWRSPTPVQDREVMSWIEQLHRRDYIGLVRQIAQDGGGQLTPDTPVSPQSYDVALLAVSAWLDGVDWVLRQHTPAFVLARPPGHHAEHHSGMGFCLFANAAIAAYYALAQSGIERVAILDWDVHHGNGSQYLTEDNPQIAYCSLHQSPCYPGTGAAQETGQHGNVLNIPLKPGSSLKDYQPAFERQIVPFLRDFRPDLLIVSAGYDANYADPLAGMSLQPGDYRLFTEFVQPLCDRLLLGLEGGYDLDTLAQSVVATVGACV